MVARIVMLVSLTLLPSSAHAADHAAALENYLTEDVAAVAYADLSKVDAQAILDWCNDLGIVPEDANPHLTKIAPMVQQKLDAYEDLGVTHVYALFRVSDIGHRGITWVVPVAEDGDARAAMGMILSGRPNQFHVEHNQRPSFLPQVCEVVDGCVLGATNSEQLEMLKTQRPTSERDLSETWELLGDGHIGFIIFGDENSRRVVRQMFPHLPAPFDSIDGKLIADGLKWGGMKLNLPPEPRFELLIDTSAEDVAQTLDQAVQELWSMVQTLPAEKAYLEQQVLDLLGKELQPRVEGKRVQISIQDVAAIAAVLRPPIEEARANAQRMQRTNQFKQIALGMLNYESANKTLPAQASYSDEGKPLLSWRVHILPYLGQQELYDKFHLDEPWDSEHNRQLHTQMPNIYADPDSALSRINGMGKTTYVMPASPATIARGKEPVKFKEIADGSSNTIMLIEVNPDNAVIWTRPDDWQVNFNRPWQGLERDDRTWFVAGFCDGHVRIFDFNISEKNLRACLTIAGGEIIEW